MSTSAFELSYAFQAFLKKTGGMISPHSHLAKFCSYADAQFPENSDEASAFAQKCISSMKKKASLLKSTCPGKFKHTERLDLVAIMCFFPHWKGFLQFADSFSKLSNSQRKTSGDSLKLCSCLWKLASNQFDEYSLGYMATSGMAFSHKAKLQFNEATTVVRNIFAGELARTSLSLTQSKNGIEESLPNPGVKTMGDLRVEDDVYGSTVENIQISATDILNMCAMNVMHLYAEHDIPRTSPERPRMPPSLLKNLSDLVKNMNRLEVDKAIDAIFSIHISTWMQIKAE